MIDLLNVVIQKNGSPIIPNVRVINYITQGTCEETVPGSGIITIGDVAQARGGLFGDASDGDVTISGTTTLTRDMFYNNITVNVGAILNTASFRVFYAGTLTNNGTIQCLGGSGSGSTNGITVASGSLPSLGASGTAISNAIGVTGSTAAIGGRGGNGNDHTSIVPTDNGIPSFTALSNVYKGVRQYFTAIEGQVLTGASVNFFYCNGTNGTSSDGTNGAQGGNGTPGAKGVKGGTGANGGYVVICGKFLSGNGLISVKGGDGADGTSGTAGTGLSGGGGGGAGGSGGNGGILVIAYGINNSTITYNISGGTRGLGGSGGSGWQNGQPGQNGTSGISGIKMEFNLG